MTFDATRLAVTGGVVLALTSASVNAEDIEARLASVFSPEVPEISCGAIPMSEDPGLAAAGFKVDVIHSGQLGSENQLAEQLASGELEMAPITSSVLAAWVEDLAVLEAYYLYDNVDQVMAVYQTDTAKAMLQELLDVANIRVIGRPWLYGERDVFGAKKIDGPEDFEGLRLRVPETFISIEGAKSFGSQPTPVSYSELYLALQQGIVDAGEAPLAVIAAESFDEPASYVNLTRHLITAQPFAVNESFWQELSGEQQEALTAAVEAASDRVRSCVEKKDAEAMAAWEEDGQVEVHAPENIEAIRAKSRAYFSQGLPISEAYKKLVAELHP